MQHINGVPLLSVHEGQVTDLFDALVADGVPMNKAANTVIAEHGPLDPAFVVWLARGLEIR